MKKTVIKKHCDKLFSELVREAGCCFRCQKKEYLQCAHIVSRRYLQTRYDFNNAICLCRGCHKYFTEHPLEWEIWIEKTFGKRYYKRLRDKALKYAKIDYEEIVYKLKRGSRK
uniref:Putative homing endonuclease n=1 Tax=viral metagenome TaxID=1070528 RepID=A0A6M3J0R8_9ZZZZ